MAKNCPECIRNIDEFLDQEEQEEPEIPEKDTPDEEDEEKPLE